MSGIEERIEKVLEAHTRDRCWWKCDAGTQMSERLHIAHVATAVLASLGLTQEWAVQFHEKAGWYGKGEMSEWSCGHERIYGDRLAAAADSDAETFVVSRLVSAWEKTS